MKQLLIDFDKVTQRQLEDYFKAFREFGGSDEKSLIEQAGACTHAAIKVGWIQSIDVENASPRDIIKIYVEVLEGINIALSAPSKN